MKKETTATWLFFLAAIFFGGAFVFIRQGVLLISPYSFLFFRCLFGSLILFLFFYKNIIKIKAQTIRYGIYIGIPFVLSLLSLAIGLETTTASKSGFIGSLYVVIVPIISMIAYRRFPSFNQTAAVIIAALGLGIISFEKNFSIQFGDVWVLMFALFLAIQIVMVGKFAKKQDPINLTFVQFVFSMLVSGFIALILGKFTIPQTYLVWQSLGYIVIFGTLGYAIQNKYQRYISDIKVGLIFGLEPVFAAALALLYLGEALTARVVIGGILILSAIIISESKKI